MEKNEEEDRVILVLNLGFESSIFEYFQVFFYSVL